MTSTIVIFGLFSPQVTHLKQFCPITDTSAVVPALSDATGAALSYYTFSTLGWGTPGYSGGVLTKIPLPVGSHVRGAIAN